MNPNSKPLRSMDAETPQPCRDVSFQKLETSFLNWWHSATLQGIRTSWISRLDPQRVFKVYVEIRRATFGTPLDTLPLEDVYKAVKIVSQYCEMTYSYAKLLDMSVYGESARKRYSEVLWNFLRPSNVARMVGFTAGLNHFGLLEKYCKWTTANLWAWGLRQKELPPIPSFLNEPQCLNYRSLGPFKQWRNTFDFSSKLAKKQDMFFLAVYLKDLYNCKGAAASVGPEFIKDALLKHKEILTTPKVSPTPVGTENGGDDRLLDAITETAESIFGPARGSLNRSPPSRFPSLNSSAEYRRNQGGAGGEILSRSDDCDEYYMLAPIDGYFFGYASHGSDVCEVRTPYDPSIWVEAEILSEKRAVAKALNDYGVDAQVIPLSEPFKVRTITKGDCDMYHLARRWQKVIHSRMRKHPRAALMGQPCSGPFLAQTFYESSMFDYSNTNGFFVSGDYESATDLLNPQLSLWAQNEISNRLRIPLEHQKVLNACLTEHNLYYGEKDENGNKITYKQTWGQLMGSPVSFPVLCLINLAATKLAYEIYREEELKGGRVTLPIEDLPMCVNGDDILFWCHSDRHYQIWKDVTANAGLKFSLGKNYTSRNYCIINSEMYRFYKHESMPFSKVPCMNTRLLEGGSRSTVTSVHPLHVRDRDLLLNDPLFDPEIHLPRFCKPLKGKGALRSLRSHFHQIRQKDEVWGDFASWFNTIEQRRTVLINQATPILSDHPGRIPGQLWAAKQMEEILDHRFSQVQLRRLNEFRALLGKEIGQHRSYNLPQCLGGFGFPKGRQYRYTGQDVRISALAYAEPKLFKKTLKSASPSLAKAGFMTMVNDELRFLTKALAIPSTTEIHQYSSYDPTDERSIFRLSLLAGFLSPSNLCIEVDEREAALRTKSNFCRPLERVDKGLSRIYNKQVEGGSEGKREIREIESDLASGIERRETILLDNFAKGYQIKTIRPNPKF